MNEYERQCRIAESTKKLYPPGTRIELISMKDPYAPVLTGTRGTVKFVDSMGTIFPEWDNGRSLGVVPGEDSFRKLTQEEIKAENQSMSEVEDYSSRLESRRNHRAICQKETGLRFAQSRNVS